MGAFRDKDLLWQIIDINEDSLLLLSHEVITKMPYDDGNQAQDELRKKYGSNEWSDSYVREWLNGPFKKELGIEPLETEHRNYVAEADKDLKEKGMHPLYWSFIPSATDWRDEEAYYYTIKDKIFLLDGFELNTYLIHNHLDYKKKTAYWLRTPMTGSSSLVRYMGTDGFVLHKDAVSEDVGILPALRISRTLRQIEGKGTTKEPFIIR